MLKNLVDRILGFKKSFSMPLSDTELDHILTHYFNDDFKLIRQENSDDFILVAYVSMGTATQKFDAKNIGLKVNVEKENEMVTFHFAGAGSVQLFYIFLAMLVISFGIISQDIWISLFLFALSFVVLFWFRGVYHHQQKTMMKYFKEDLKKFRHFKNKGFDYFSRKKN